MMAIDQMIPCIYLGLINREGKMMWREVGVSSIHRCLLLRPGGSLNNMTQASSSSATAAPGVHFKILWIKQRISAGWEEEATLTRKTGAVKRVSD